jgi:hypothetical protein
MEVGNPGILAPFRRQQSRTTVTIQTVTPSDVCAQSKEGAQGRSSIGPYTRPVPTMANTSSSVIQCSVMVAVSNGGRCGAGTPDGRTAECSGVSAETCCSLHAHKGSDLLQERLCADPLYSGSVSAEVARG